MVHSVKRSSSDKLAGRQPVCCNSAPVRVAYTVPLVATLEVRHGEIGPLDVQSSVEKVELGDLAEAC